MNDNAGKFDEVISSIVEMDLEEPANSAKNMLSQKALTFISDYSVETGIRHMSIKLEKELMLGTETIEKHIKPDSYPYEFGKTVYSHNKNDGSIIMLPFDKVDFEIDMSNQFVKKRLVNDAVYFLVSLILFLSQF